MCLMAYWVEIETSKTGVHIKSPWKGRTWLNYWRLDWAGLKRENYTRNERALERERKEFGETSRTRARRTIKRWGKLELQAGSYWEIVGKRHNCSLCSHTLWFSFFSHVCRPLIYPWVSEKQRWESLEYPLVYCTNILLSTEKDQSRDNERILKLKKSSIPLTNSLYVVHPAPRHE